MGGTMGSVVGEKVARAFNIATRKRLPVVSILASGGARIQEGMVALMQMAKTAGAVAQHHAERLLYVSVLTDPSFGGTFASFGSLGDVLIGEPGANIGFVGSRVVEGTISEAIPEDARRAEVLLEHGMIDMVVPRRSLRNLLAVLVSQLTRDRSTNGHRCKSHRRRNRRDRPPRSSSSPALPTVRVRATTPSASLRPSSSSTGIAATVTIRRFSRVSPICKAARSS